MSFRYERVRWLIALILAVSFAIYLIDAISRARPGGGEGYDQFNQLELSLFDLIGCSFMSWLGFSAIILWNALDGNSLNPLFHLFGLGSWFVFTVTTFAVYSATSPGIGLVAPENILELCTLLIYLGTPVFTICELVYSLKQPIGKHLP